MSDYPEPQNPIGYAAQEIADIAGCSINIAREAVDRALYASTKGIDPETGERLVYKCDLFRAIRYINISAAIDKLEDISQIDAEKAAMLFFDKSLEDSYWLDGVLMYDGETLEWQSINRQYVNVSTYDGTSILLCDGFDTPDMPDVRYHEPKDDLRFYMADIPEPWVVLLYNSGAEPIDVRFGYGKTQQLAPHESIQM